MKQIMKNKRLARILSGLLALVLLLSLCPTAFAAKGSVNIGTLKELTDLAKRCASDSYSSGLSVVLTADIDADGAAVSIPIFLGSFDGQGHKITGLRLTESNSTYGLFSRIESGAVVKDLRVEGEVTPSGTQELVGGLAGENKGRIENCSFSGIVVASGRVGGLAGSNDGSIIGCTVSGVVRGTQYTGGIAGQNSGTLLRCENAAAVNTTVSDADLASADISGLENTIYSILKREDTHETAVTADTGGIVGQMVPDITLQFSESGLVELQAELNTLQSLINRTLDDAQSASDSVSGRVARISGYADSARDSAHSLTNQLGGFVDSNIDTVNNLLLLIERYLAKLTPIMDDLDTASSSIAESVAQMRKLLALLEDTLAYNDTALSQLQSFCTEMEAACDSMLAGLDALEKAFSLMKDEPAMPDTAQLRADTAKLLAALTQLNEVIDTAVKEYRNTDSVSEATQARLNDALQAAFNCYSAVVSDLNDLINNTDLDGLRSQNEETLRQILASLQTAMDSFYSATSHLSAAMGHLYDALGTLRAINGQAEKIFAQLDTTLSAVQRAAEAMSRAMSKAAKWVRDLSNEEVGSFSPLGPEFSESSDALNTSLSGISNELSALNSEIAASNTVLLSDMRAVNNQFMKVMNLFLNVLNNTQNVDYTDIFEDVSEESLQSAVRGKVLECTNRGSVAADRNAGGIAGAMAIEYDTDPEDDLLSSQNRSAHFTYQTKAILLDCSNYGSVQAKKSCAGGITGRMDLGTISGCGGWGSVGSESGDYAGGVAGLSLSSVRRSYAKCTLSGGKYVGGILGSGRRVSDCISMVAITDHTQLGGAIAGEITGEYSNNRFVSDTLAGVDRVSYAGKAEQISYDELCAIENIPENFLHLTLRFVAEDSVLREQEFAYGASFTEEVFPAIPSKDGCYGQWDTADLSELHFDTVVTATYEPYITTLASDTQRDGRAAVLVEGQFRDGDCLRADQIIDLSSALTDAIEAWGLQIPEDGQSSHRIRWRIPADGEDAYTVYTLQENGWKKVSSEQIGSYLCFAMTGDGQFAVVPAGHAAWWVWVLAILAVILLITLLIIRQKRRRSHARPPEQPQCSEEAPAL